MKLRRSVILAFCVIVVLATAGILIAYNFRAAMFDRTSEIVSTAPEPVPAEELKEPQEEEPMQAETAAPPSSITAEEQIEPPAKPQVAPEDKPDDGELSVIPEAAETEESIETASESTLTEPTAISDTESNEPEIHNLIAEYDILGYSLSAETDGESVRLIYPGWIDRNDVASFFGYEDSRYGLADAGYSYSIPENGIAVIKLPSAMDNEEIRNELDILVSDLLGYLQPGPETEPEPENEEYTSPSPAIEEIEIEAIVPEPAMESPENPVQPIETAGVESSQKGFTLLIKGGALTAFDGVWSPEFGIGLDFSRMAAMGDAASFGLRSDISVNLFPVLTKMAGVYDGMLLIASIPSCSVMGSIDLKLMMDFTAGPADIYLGGGLGGAIGSAGYNSRMSSYFGYQPTEALRLDWFASAVAGVRFSVTDMISIGAEASYRYMIGSGKHMLSADIVFGISF